jgi:ectoine hydroxylase-related dioxygenase (phytanoyl-CoA dioxygenase family)
MSSLLADPVEARSSDLGPRVAQVVEEQGFAVVTGLLEATECAGLVDEVQRIEREHAVGFGKNDFEGFRTRRIFNLIARGPRFRDIVLNETVLASVEAILGEGFLLSGTTSMHISPGETPQLLHPDDGMVRLPRPHPATMVTTLWALSDFTEENGATRLVPRSHLQKAVTPGAQEVPGQIAAEMPAGSVLVLHASTWHGGGPNSTPAFERYGLSIQFVGGWCRQQQNLMLGTSPELVAQYPRRLQELIGYSIYRNVMGHVDRKHPLGLLGVQAEQEMVWDKLDKQSSQTREG